MPTDGRTKGYSLGELLVTLAIFGLLSVVLVTVLNMVARIWYRSSARDDAVRQLHQARARLVQDLANSSQQPGQSATARVGPNLGTGFDGDALSFLSSDGGTGSSTWNIDPATGRANSAAQITYYLVIPNAPNKYQITAGTGAPDAAGYEQQCPCKWLVRRTDPVPAPAAGTDPAVAPTWTTWLTRPTSILATPTQLVVADQMLQFRVLSKPPKAWTIQLSAVAVSEATRAVSLGNVPLSQSKYTSVEQFSVPAHN